jgi:hypothetical protein
MRTLSDVIYGSSTVIGYARGEEPPASSVFNDIVLLTFCYRHFDPYNVFMEAGSYNFNVSDITHEMHSKDRKPVYLLLRVTIWLCLPVGGKAFS